MEKNTPKQKEDAGLVVFFHGIIVLLIWASPLLVPWWIIVIGIVAYFVQLMIFGDCVLTKWQYETKKRGPTFYYYALTKFGFKTDVQQVRWIADNVMPWVILGIALILQFGLEYNPVF